MPSESFAPLLPVEAECREKFGDGNFFYLNEPFPEDVPRTCRITLRSRDGERIEIGRVENREGHPVLVGGVSGLNGPDLAEWLNRERLGLSSDEIAQIIANPPKPKPGKT